MRAFLVICGVWFGLALGALTITGLISSNWLYLCGVSGWAVKSLCGI